MKKGIIAVLIIGMLLVVLVSGCASNKAPPAETRERGGIRERGGTGTTEGTGTTGGTGTSEGAGTTAEQQQAEAAISGASSASNEISSASSSASSLNENEDLAQTYEGG